MQRFKQSLGVLFYCAMLFEDLVVTNASQLDFLHRNQANLI